MCIFGQSQRFSLQQNSSYFSECDQPDLRIYDQISNARDRVTAARKHLTEIEDKVQSEQASLSQT